MGRYELCNVNESQTPVDIVVDYIMRPVSRLGAMSNNGLFVISINVKMRYLFTYFAGAATKSCHDVLILTVQLSGSVLW
jgi:hypothetical protein